MGWRALRAMAVAFALLAATAEADAASEGEREYLLRPGDRIQVKVYGHEDLSGEFELNSAGTVSFPLVGRVALEGLSVGGAEAALIAALRPDYLKQPSVAVEVLNYRPVSVLGEVEMPGRYDYERGLTVMEAIAMAGGYSYRARKSRVSIIRSGQSDAQARDAEEATRVLPGDTIRVPQRLF